MNIGVVSMLSNNYGALLQSYALQTTLEKLGCNVIIVNRRWGTLVDKIPLLQKIKNAKDCIFNKKSEFDKFRNQYLNLSNRIRTNKDLMSINGMLDVVITGSDQVWHEGCYNVMGLYFFLDWVDYPKVKRYSYAASFGKDSFSKYKNDIDAIKVLLQTFSGISVREFSGIDICKHDFHIDAECHLDPTLLLDAEDYNSILVKQSKIDPFICSYMLDSSEQKNNIVEYLASRNQLKVVNNIQEENVISVKQWIQNIRDAKFVITDSFHGTVFSIIFKKKFVCINNKKRGATRFESLLCHLGLIDRLIDIDACRHEEIMGIMIENIDYQAVFRILNSLKNSSMRYLKEIINNEQ